MNTDSTCTYQPERTCLIVHEISWTGHLHTQSDLLLHHLWEHPVIPIQQCCTSWPHCSNAYSNWPDTRTESNSQVSPRLNQDDCSGTPLLQTPVGQQSVLTWILQPCNWQCPCRFKRCLRVGVPLQRTCIRTCWKLPTISIVSVSLLMGNSTKLCPVSWAKVRITLLFPQ